MPFKAVFTRFDGLEIFVVGNQATGIGGYAGAAKLDGPKRKYLLANHAGVGRRFEGAGTSAMGD